jgi:hypothetical protein
MNTSDTTQITPGPPGDWKELASRESNGLVTSLFWSSESGDVKVVVLDLFHHDVFELDVDPAEALDAYRHPFAYASRPRTHAAPPLSADLQPLS